MGETTSELKSRLGAEIKEALKAGDRTRLGALRLLSAGVTNREKEVRHALSDEEVQEVATREVKKRNEAIEAFEAAGRHELAAKEREERAALAAYVPEQLSEAEVDALIADAVEATGATSVQEMGKVMGAVMGGAKGRVDGSLVQQKVRARLAE